MNCQQCGYSLWNLRARQCPECGSAFKPSDFDFRANAVTFSCPHCAQSYYGTSERGHLIPPEFDCVQCGNHVHMDEMVMLPAANVDERKTTLDQNPWVQRARTGGFKALFKTMGAAMTRPTSLMRTSTHRGTNRDAAWFLTIITILYVTVGVGPIFGFIAMVTMSFSNSWVALSAFAGIFLLVLLASILAPMLWALSIHGSLRLSGSTKGLGTTFQAVSYSSPCNVLMALPCFSFYVAWISWVWWAVACSLMLIEAHAIKPWRAVAAVFALPAVMIVSGMGLVGTLIYLDSQSSWLTPSVRVQPLTPAGGQAQIVGDAVLDWAYRHQGQGPQHVAQLLDSGLLHFGGLKLPGSSSQLSQFTVDGAVSFGQWQGMTAPQRQQLAQQVVAAMPADVVAHRVGDYVFAHHGVDVFNDSPDLWLTIAYPDPAQNPNWGPGEVVAVVTSGGWVEEIDFVDLPQQLSLQNQLRQTEGVAPLPDPATVQAGQPATASP